MNNHENLVPFAPDSEVSSDTFVEGKEKELDQELNRLSDVPFDDYDGDPDLYVSELLNDSYETLRTKLFERISMTMYLDLLIRNEQGLLSRHDTQSLDSFSNSGLHFSAVERDYDAVKHDQQLSSKLLEKYKKAEEKIRQAIDLVKKN